MAKIQLTPGPAVGGQVREQGNVGAEWSHLPDRELLVRVRRVVEMEGHGVLVRDRGDLRGDPLSPIASIHVQPRRGLFIPEIDDGDHVERVQLFLLWVFQPFQVLVETNVVDHEQQRVRVDRQKPLWKVGGAHEKKSFSVILLLLGIRRHIRDVRGAVHTHGLVVDHHLPANGAVQPCPYLQQTPSRREDIHVRAIAAAVHLWKVLCFVCFPAWHGRFESVQAPCRSQHLATLLLDFVSPIQKDVLHGQLASALEQKRHRLQMALRTTLAQEQTQH
mmetsp:Transcript_23212/g.46593  ORF Transcript_23212/g.46593 Transcript_23212/m.46593 type:complete len:276 (+) Transcript_23212:3762-4589(+)